MVSRTPLFLVIGGAELPVDSHTTHPAVYGNHLTVDHINTYGKNFQLFLDRRLAGRYIFQLLSGSRRQMSNSVA